MERRLRELDRLDEQLGLGEHQVHRPVGAPVPLARGQRGRRARRVRRERKPRSPVVPGLLVVALIMAGVFLVDPSESGRRLRELVGVDGRLGELVGVEGDGGQYRFATTQPDSKDPVSWNPCQIGRAHV